MKILLQHATQAMIMSAERKPQLPSGNLMFIFKKYFEKNGAKINTIQTGYC